MYLFIYFIFLSLGINGLAHVINYDMPYTIGQYIRRIGRLGVFNKIDKMKSQ